MDGVGLGTCPANGIGDDGACALAAALSSTLLVALDLWGNRIGDRGMLALEQVLPQTQLETLYGTYSSSSAGPQSTDLSTCTWRVTCSSRNAWFSSLARVAVHCAPARLVVHAVSRAIPSSTAGHYFNAARCGKKRALVDARSLLRNVRRQDDRVAYLVCLDRAP